MKVAFIGGTMHDVWFDDVPPLYYRSHITFRRGDENENKFSISFEETLKANINLLMILESVHGWI